jgi:DNA-binding LytR/AlgR family response regulator
MQTLVQALAIASILANAVVYGTDFFCAIVLRPALARVSDTALTSVMGEVHRYGDRRMPIPGAIGVVTALLSVIIAAVAGHPGAAVSAGIAAVALILWLVTYGRISAPVNKQLTAAATQGITPSNARTLQRTWDSVINLRVALQLIALLALCYAVLAA